jgi:hypothetical protein
MSARTETVTIGNVLAAHASQFGYSEAADRAEIWDLTYPELLARLAAGETITGDCSSTWEAVCKDAGAPQGPLGYTGSELDDMPHIALADALQGDGIVFGEWPGLHVVWITSPHPTNPPINAGHIDPKIDSHGMPGFTQTDLNTMWNTVFPGQPITVLSLAPFLPKPPPTPLEEDMIVAVADKNGNVHVFQETSDGTVYSSAQQIAGGPYSPPFVVMKDGKAPAK